MTLWAGGKGLNWSILERFINTKEVNTILFTFHSIQTKRTLIHTAIPPSILFYSQIYQKGLGSVNTIDTLQNTAAKTQKTIWVWIVPIVIVLYIFSIMFISLHKTVFLYFSVLCTIGPYFRLFSTRVEQKYKFLQLWQPGKDRKWN